MDATGSWQAHAAGADVDCTCSDGFHRAGTLVGELDGCWQVRVEGTDEPLIFSSSALTPVKPSKGDTARVHTGASAGFVGQVLSLSDDGAVALLRSRDSTDVKALPSSALCRLRLDG